MKVEKEGDRNGPAVRPTVFVSYLLINDVGYDVADWRLGVCLVMCGPV